jgi:hypothetical protein
MKTALQTFLENAEDSLKQMDCELLQKINDLLQLEKECVVGAYEAGMIAASNDLKIDAMDYFKRFYSDPNENSNARIDMQLGFDTGQSKKRKRKRIS